MAGFMAPWAALARALLSDTRARRQWMFVSTLLVMIFVFGGYFFLGGFLRQHPLIFAFYLLASLTALVFIALFALFDMLVVTQQLRAARRAAAQELVKAVRADLTPEPTEPPE